VTVDAALGRLVEGLRQRGTFETTNIVVLSDHGMTATSAERVVVLDQIVNVDHIELVSAIVNAGINPKAGFEAEVERALTAPHPHLQCWKKGSVPKRFHYGRNARIPAIVCLPDDGWMVVTAAMESSRRGHVPLGEHGYDNNDPQMRALFMAHGPAFKQHLTVPVFDNINVYALLAKLLGVTPRPNEGNVAVTAGMLRASDGSGTIGR
jgi:predicted AlkP superfamily pyrophosphatase or phosphodiesterase